MRRFIEMSVVACGLALFGASEAMAQELSRDAEDQRYYAGILPGKSRAAQQRLWSAYHDGGRAVARRRLAELPSLSDDEVRFTWIDHINNLSLSDQADRTARILTPDMIRPRLKAHYQRRAMEVTPPLPQ